MYRRTVIADNAHSGAYFNLGYLLQFEKEELDEAEDAYRNAIRAEPTHSGALNNLGYLLYFHKSSHAEAEVLFPKNRPLHHEF
jgi:Tfp pilus assembly protein PilF